MQKSQSLDTQQFTFLLIGMVAGALIVAVVFLYKLYSPAAPASVLYPTSDSTTETKTYDPYSMDGGKGYDSMDGGKGYVY